MKASLTALLLVVPLALFATGCVSQQRADDLATANRSLKEQVVRLQQEIAELENRVKLLSGSDTASANELTALRNERDTLKAQLDRLLAQNADLRMRATNLSPELEDALKKFAGEHSDIATYDAETGAVKFASDLTFALGSAELSANASSALKQLATILNSTMASQYEVRIVGHTDSVPISRPSTKAQYPNNWYLSVARAISVRDALSSDGVPDVRTSVAGYAFYRPVVANTRRGAEANRRVEIYLVPMTSVNEQFIKPSGAAPASSTGSTVQPATPSSRTTTNEGPGELYK